MIRSVIIDDEKDARFILRNLIEKKLAGKLEVIGEADDVGSGIELIKRKKPDLIFLDIQMKNGTGFDLLKDIEGIDLEVIFVTAFNEFAIKAFKVSAIGYLLKPVKYSELSEAVAQVERRMEKQSPEIDSRVKILVENNGKKGEVQKLVIFNVEGFKVLEIGSILRLEGDGNYTHFMLSDNRKITASRSIGEYEDILEDHGFFRIHQSTIVNLRHIVGYIKAGGGYVEMSDGTSHKVSRYRKKLFLERF